MSSRVRSRACAVAATFFAVPVLMGAGFPGVASPEPQTAIISQLPTSGALLGGAVTPLKIEKQVTLDAVPVPPPAALPTSGYRLTGTFGNLSSLWSSGSHTGLDFAAPSGTAITSVTAGTVIAAGYEGSYGYLTKILTADGAQYWYAHQSLISVSVGQKVDAGERIGSVGTTGNVTGAHLHLEVRVDDKTPVDPYGALIGLGLRP